MVSITNELMDHLGIINYVLLLVSHVLEVVVNLLLLL